jgi:hypothetical protein
MLFEFDKPKPIKCTPGLDISIKGMIDYLSANWEHPEQINYGVNHLELVNVLRKACTEQLHSIWSECEGGETRLIEIYLDALSEVGTNESLEFLTEKILSGSLSIQRISSIMLSASVYNDTTPSMLKQILRLAKADYSTVFPEEDIHAIKDLSYQSWTLLGSAIRAVKADPVEKVS